MALRIETNAEPIPGYKLIERLGAGGFGEVWKAEAPGGFCKAVKFVYGNLESHDSGGSRAEQELKSLSRVKSVQHPYILSLERYDIVEGQLVIVMELAQGTLWDRFKECRNEGMIGIPREELLNYMEETAEALDLMNVQYQLQHLDIKPQNIFLVHSHVKVADFGLVKTLEGMAATVTGGVTPVYAAPETFDGWASRFSDQYSQAIVYQELLTGQRPYNGTSMRQLVLQHLQGAPDLSSLSLADRPIIERALSKNPDARHPSCKEFIQALRDATRPKEPAVKEGTAADVGPAPPSSRRLTQSTLSQSGLSQSGLSQSGVASAPSTSTNGLLLDIPSELPPSSSSSDLPVEVTRDSRRVRPRRPRKPSDSQLASAAAASAASAPSATTAQQETPSALKSKPSTRTNRSVKSAVSGGVMVPSLVIGLGKMGLGVLRHLRQELNEQFGCPESIPHLRLLYLDTDADAVELATDGDPVSALRLSELLPTRLHRAAHYLKPRDGTPKLDRWLNSKLLYRIPKQQTGAGVRALGRLAFVDNYRGIVKRLENELTACVDPEAITHATERTGLDFLRVTPRVYIVTSLVGATGSGMFLDLAYVLRQMLKRKGHTYPEINGVLMLPPSKKGAVPAPMVASTVAALTELNHFSRPSSTFVAQYEGHDGAQKFQETGAAFQRCLLLPLGEAGSGALREAEARRAQMRAGHFLFCDLFTPLGRNAEEKRRGGKTAKADVPTLFQTVGSYRILWPRKQLLRQAGSRLGRRLLKHWMSKDAKPFAEEIRVWAQQQWEAQNLRPESLITRHQEQCELILKQAPEALLAQVIGPLAAALAAPEADGINLSPVVQAMDQLDRLLGIPDESKLPGPGMGREASVIEAALREASAAVAADCDQALSALIVCLLEEPAYRLAGAEEAIRQFSGIIEQALQPHEQLAKELQDRAIVLLARINQLLECPSQPQKENSSRSLWRALTRRTPEKNKPSFAQELVELLKAYPKCRYQSIVLQHITNLYVSLRGHLSDQLREIGFCRTRLLELETLLQTSFTPARDEESKSGPYANKCLLPVGCNSLDDAVGKLDAQVKEEDLLAFDAQVQALLRRQCGALVQVCMASSTTIKELAPQLQLEAEHFLASRLDVSNVVEMYMAHLPSPEQGDLERKVQDELQTAFDEALPDFVRGTVEDEIALLAVPAGPLGERVRDLAAKALPNVKIVATDLTDEILLYRDCSQLNVNQLDHLGPAGQEAYKHAQAQDATLWHSRGDIIDWRPTGLSR